MNENIPPVIPPTDAARKVADAISTLPPTPWHGERPLGENPDERVPVSNAFAAVEALLRQPRRLLYQLRQPGAGGLIVQMIFVSAVCALVYGFVAGTFSGGTQLWAAPVKIAGGLLVSAAICLPSLFIFTCLSGAQSRLAEVCGLLAGLLMLMTILLVGFAPVAWIFSQSTESLAWMGALHLAFWFVATLFGVRFLKNGFIHANARSQAGVNVWIIIFLLVAVQMTTALRPIIGHAETFFPTEKKFFLVHWFDNVAHPGDRAKTETAEASR
jgi:hypothetical protein